MKKFLIAVLAALLCVAPAQAINQRHPTQWTYYTVDSSASSYNVLTGINNLNTVTGYRGTGTVSDPFIAEESQEPYASFTDINYPGETDSVATGLSNTFFQVGYYLTPGSTVAYYRDRGKYTAYPVVGAEFLGENHILCGGGDCHGSKGNKTDPLIVGFQPSPESNTGLISEAIEFDPVTNSVTTFSPPGAEGAVASGVNGKGHVCGYFMAADGTVKSWLYLNMTGEYFEFSYPGATATYALALNWQDNVVGYYVDAAGKQHGFIYSYPNLPHQAVWQSIDEPNAVGGTVVHSMNDSDNFVGSYVDGAGVTHGFLAIPQIP